MKNLNRRTLIITPDPFEKQWADTKTISRKDLKTFSGTKKIIYRKNDFIGLRKQLSNAVLVLDDFKAYGDISNKEKEALRYLCVRRAQKQLDIFIIAHGFTEIVPTYLFTFASYYIIFKTRDSIKKVKNRIKNFELVDTSVNEVDKNKDHHYYKIINLNE